MCFELPGFESEAVMGETIRVLGRTAFFSGCDPNWYIHDGRGMKSDYFIRPGVWNDSCGNRGFFPTEAAAREFAAKHADATADQDNGIVPGCSCGWCGTDGYTKPRTRMYVCEFCGDKRCPHASCHAYGCTGTKHADQPEPSASGGVELHASLAAFLVQREWHTHQGIYVSLSDADSAEAAGELLEWFRGNWDPAEPELAELRAEVERLTKESARRNHGASGLCCQLRLQEKDRADQATTRAETAEREREVLREALTKPIGQWMSPLQIIQHTAERGRITSPERFIEWCQEYAPQLTAALTPKPPTAARQE